MAAEDVVNSGDDEVDRTVAIEDDEEISAEEVLHLAHTFAADDDEDPVVASFDGLQMSTAHDVLHLVDVVEDAQGVHVLPLEHGLVSRDAALMYRMLIYAAMVNERRTKASERNWRTIAIVSMIAVVVFVFLLNLPTIYRLMGVDNSELNELRPRNAVIVVPDSYKSKGR